MAHQINTMYAATFYISSSQTLYMTNDLTGSATAVTFPAGYYTPYLANTGSADGTQQAPWCFIQKTREKVGSYFNFTLESDGKVKIAYRGTGTGMISFVSSSLLKNILGFTTTSSSFTSGSSVTATYQPFGAVFAINSTQTDDWQTQLSQQAYEELPNGIVYGFKDDIFKHTRKQTLRFFPKNQTFKDSLAVYPSTPIFPVSKSQWQQPTIDPYTYTPPFTFLQFLRMSTGKPVQVVHGTFQANISGTNLEYDSAYLRPGYFGIEGFQKVSIPNYDALRDVPEIELILSSSDSRQVWDAPTVTTAAFSPSDISSLYAWYRGDLVTYDGSNKVSVWPDKSGNGNHLSQSNSAKQPVYSGSISSRNNQPGIHATGGAYLQAENFALRTYKTIFMVVGSTGSMSYVSSLYNDGVEYFYAYHPGNATFYNRDNSTGYHYINNTGGNFFQANVNHTFEYDGVTPTLYRSSSNVAGTVVGSATADNYATGSFRLFYGWGGGYSSTMQILEVLVYNKALNSTERTQVWDYLATRYGS